jgi:hypothetical protein
MLGLREAVNSTHSSAHGREANRAPRRGHRSDRSTDSGRAPSRGGAAPRAESRHLAAAEPICVRIAGLTRPGSGNVPRAVAALTPYCAIWGPSGKNTPFSGPSGRENSSTAGGLQKDVRCGLVAGYCPPDAKCTRSSRRRDDACRSCEEIKSHCRSTRRFRARERGTCAWSTSRHDKCLCEVGTKRAAPGWQSEHAQRRRSCSLRASRLRRRRQREWESRRGRDSSEGRRNTNAGSCRAQSTHRGRQDHIRRQSSSDEVQLGVDQLVMLGASITQVHADSRLGGRTRVRRLCGVLCFGA